MGKDELYLSCSFWTNLHCQKEETMVEAQSQITQFRRGSRIFAYSVID